MMVIVAGVMIGLCLTIMEQGARKAHTHTKEQSLAKQPRVKVGDRVRITQSYSFYNPPGTCGAVVYTHPATNSFEMKTDTSYGTLTIAEVCGDKWELLQPAKEQTMTQKFKKGDRVRIIPSAASYSSCRIGQTGIIMQEKMGQSYDNRVQFCDGEWTSYKSEDLELLPKTLDNLVEGDVVVDKDDTDDTMTVAHVLKPGLYVIADDEEEPQLYTATKLKYLDYVPQQDPEDDKTCLTVADVAKKLGLNPDKLHIVADKKAA
jgi:hypothetical protein